MMYVDLAKLRFFSPFWRVKVWSLMMSLFTTFSVGATLEAAIAVFIFWLKGVKNQFYSQRHTVCSLLLVLEGLVANQWTGFFHWIVD